MNGSELPENKYPHLRNHLLGFDEKVLKLKIDSEKQNYLKDHIFGGESFVPATMIIELLFESSLYYCEYILKMNVDKIKPVKLEHFDILRALKMQPGDSIEAKFEFNDLKIIDDKICIDVRIISDRVNKNKKVLGTRVNVTSLVVLSENIYESVKLQIPDKKFSYYQLDKKKFYARYFPSLGPLFQTSCAKFGIDESKNYYLAKYDCDNHEMRFIKDQNSKFLTSPLGNDSCLQAAVFFSRIINLIGRLPVGGEELYFYKEHPAEGEVTVFIEKVEIDSDMKCNIYSFDENGIIFYAKGFIVRKSPYHRLMDREEFEEDINGKEIEESYFHKIKCN